MSYRERDGKYRAGCNKVAQIRSQNCSRESFPCFLRLLADFARSLACKYLIASSDTHEFLVHSLFSRARPHSLVSRVSCQTWRRRRRPDDGSVACQNDKCGATLSQHESSSGRALQTNEPRSYWIEFYFRSHLSLVRVRSRACSLARPAIRAVSLWRISGG